MEAGKDAVVVDHLFKAYRVYASPVERVKRLLGGSSRFLDFEALHDVCFTVPAGTALGIIGENGAGKSTLLKIIAGTTRTTLGSVSVDGVVAAILELGAAFHPEFSGRENAVLYGALMGLDRSQVTARLDDIVAFAELGGFIDHPIKSYSTGMMMRLAFAVATHVDADILVVDEALAVGDGYFQKKCVDRILEIKDRGTTILFCSHAMYFVTRFCDRAVWLKEGRIEQQGEVKPVVEAYEAYLLTRGKRILGAAEDDGAETPATVGAQVGRITRLELRSTSSRSAAELAPDDGVEVLIEVDSARPEEVFHVGVTFDTLDGRCLLGLSTHWDQHEPLCGDEHYRLRLVIESLPVASGTFHVSAFLFDGSGLHLHDQVVVQEAVRVNPERWTPSLITSRHLWRREAGRG